MDALILELLRGGGAFGLSVVVNIMLWREISIMRREAREDAKANQSLLTDLVREGREDRRRIADQVGAHLESRTDIPVLKS